MEVNDTFVFEPDITSYHEFANYLCREVFTDMSVLPLVFPSNISCFSSGSYKEELSRTRELPVPPQPRRSGVLARSDDNLAGGPCSLLSSLPISLEDRSSLTLTRHSSYTWLREEDEEDDTCLLAAQLRRRYEEVRRAAVEQSRESQAKQDPLPCELQSSATPQQSITLSPHLEEQSDQEEIQQTDQTINTTTEEKETSKDSSFDKMSVFKKKEKASLFQRTIDRLSFKSRKKKDKDKTFSVEVIPQGKAASKSSPPKVPEVENEIKELEESPKLSPKYPTPSPPPPAPAPARPTPALPASARYSQSRPLNQLDQALKNFKLDTAKSRENLSASRPDLSLAISAFSSKPCTPRLEVKSPDNKPVPPRTSPQSAGPPPAASSRWRQVAPSANKYVESEWARLSASMMNLSRGESKRDLSTSSWRETNLSGSNMSLDMRGEREEREREVSRLDRAMSVNVLASTDSEESGAKARSSPGVWEVPDNQLRDLNSYQRRIQASMEKLNVPSWCKTLKQTPTAPPTPTLRPPASRPASSTLSSSWRTSSLSSTGGWRRSSTLERRDRTLPALSSRLTPAKKQMYLGWRSQERLDIGPVYLTNPAQRLASSAVQVKTNSKEEKKEENVKEDIKEVTEAILDFCSSPVPMPVKQAWISNDGEDSDNSDNPDDDSGIDRSDDFTQEILNEA